MDEDDDNESTAANQRYTVRTGLAQGPNPEELRKVQPTVVNWLLISGRTEYGHSDMKRASGLPSRQDHYDYGQPKMTLLIL